MKGSSVLERILFLEKIKSDMMDYRGNDRMLMYLKPHYSSTVLDLQRIGHTEAQNTYIKWYNDFESKYGGITYENNKVLPKTKSKASKTKVVR